MVFAGTLDNGVDGPNGGQEHDDDKHNDVDHVCPEVKAGFLRLHDHQPDDTGHPEGHGSKPKGPKESKQVCRQTSRCELQVILSCDKQASDKQCLYGKCDKQ